jgi:hypothetical protein
LAPEFISSTHSKDAVRLACLQAAGAGAGLLTVDAHIAFQFILEIGLRRSLYGWIFVATGLFFEYTVPVIFYLSWFSAKIN